MQAVPLEIVVIIALVCILVGILLGAFAFRPHIHLHDPGMYQQPPYGPNMPPHHYR